MCIRDSVDIDADVIDAYMKELDATDETRHQFVKSWIQAGGIGNLEEALANNGFGFNTVALVR